MDRPSSITNWERKTTNPEWTKEKEKEKEKAKAKAKEKEKEKERHKLVSLVMPQFLCSSVLQCSVSSVILVLVVFVPALICLFLVVDTAP